MKIKSFTFNPFQENTYILYNDIKQAIIIDPGMYMPEEFDQFYQFIEMNRLEPIMLLNTHTHLDHLFGNASVLNRYKIPFGFHIAETPVFKSAKSAGALYGLTFEQSPEPTFYLKEGELVQFGTEQFEILLTPGHSPGSLCFYNETFKILISGDVLFQNSIGRADLPGGNYEDLINSIKSQLMPLPDDVTVYSGHGPATSIGAERRNNPFLK